MKTIKNKISSIKNRLLSMKEEPQKVAFGYALGIFLATTPFIGMKALIALVISKLCKWKISAAVIGVYHINSLTGPFFYAFSFLLGKSIMGYDCFFHFPEHLEFKAMIQCFAGSKEIFISLLVGGLIIGIPLSIMAYHLMMSLLGKHREIGCLQPN